MPTKPWQNSPTCPGPVLFTIDDFNRMIDAGIVGQAISPECLPDASLDLQWLFVE